MTHETDIGVSAQKRVAVKARDAAKLVNIASIYSLPGVDWNYYNTVYKLLDFHNHWPQGMALHTGWQDSGFWSTISLWNNDETVEQYFGSVAIERISKAIQLLGAVSNRDGATDVEPERHKVANLILGPHSRKFVDIGEDRDGSAVHVLGGDPITVQLTVDGLTPELYFELIERLDYKNTLPAELIAHFATTEEGEMRVLELWSGRGHALATLGSDVLPAIDRIARKHVVDLPCDHTTNEVKRIALSDEVVTAFGF
jgi:hypothetical protein